MARGGRSGRRSRDANDIANRSVASFRRLLPFRWRQLEYYTRQALAAEDRRLWTPYRPWPAKRRSGSTRIGLVIRSPVRVSWHGVGFRDPTSVMICIRRKIRREVMHALGAAGGRVRRPRRNFYSNVRC